jgi:hypothetical protein
MKIAKRPYELKPETKLKKIRKIMATFKKEEPSKTSLEFKFMYHFLYDEIMKVLRTNKEKEFEYDC